MTMHDEETKALEASHAAKIAQHAALARKLKIRHFKMKALVQDSAAARAVHEATIEAHEDTLSDLKEEIATVTRRHAEESEVNIAMADDLHIAETKHEIAQEELVASVAAHEASEAIVARLTSANARAEAATSEAASELETLRNAVAAHELAASAATITVGEINSTVAELERTVTVFFYLLLSI